MPNAGQPIADQLQTALHGALVKARSLKDFQAELYSLSFTGGDNWWAVLRLIPRRQREVPLTSENIGAIAKELSHLIHHPVKFRQFMLGKNIRLVFAIQYQQR